MHNLIIMIWYEIATFTGVSLNNEKYAFMPLDKFISNR